jgi:hypothetical protein
MSGAGYVFCGMSKLGRSTLVDVVERVSDVAFDEGVELLSVVFFPGSVCLLSCEVEDLSVWVVMSRRVMRGRCW